MAYPPSNNSSTPNPQNNFQNAGEQLIESTAVDVAISTHVGTTAPTVSLIPISLILSDGAFLLS